MEAWPWRQGAHPGRSVAYLNNSNEVRGMNRASWQREVALLSGGTIVDETVTNSETGGNGGNRTAVVVLTNDLTPVWTVAFDEIRIISVGACQCKCHTYIQLPLVTLRSARDRPTTEYSWPRFFSQPFPKTAHERSRFQPASPFQFTLNGIIPPPRWCFNLQFDGKISVETKFERDAYRILWEWNWSLDDYVDSIE